LAEGDDVGPLAIGEATDASGGGVFRRGCRLGRLLGFGSARRSSR
jgi:hypothetical protein